MIVGLNIFQKVSNILCKKNVKLVKHVEFDRMLNSSTLSQNSIIAKYFRNVADVGNYIFSGKE